MDTIHRALNILAEDSEWVTQAICRSLQSSSVYAISMAATTYLDQIQSINELVERAPDTNPIPLNEEALAKFERTAVSKALLYHLAGEKLPHTKTVDPRQTIVDLSSGVSYGVSAQIKSKEQGQLNEQAIEFMAEELDMSTKAVKALAANAAADEKARQEFQKQQMAIHLREVMLLTEEALRYFHTGEMSPWAELTALEKIVDKVEHFKLKKLFDMMNSRSASRNARAGSDYKSLKKTFDTLNEMVGDLAHELESSPTTGEPADFLPNERIEKFAHAVQSHAGVYFADNQPTETVPSIEDALIAEEEEDEDDD